MQSKKIFFLICFSLLLIAYACKKDKEEETKDTTPPVITVLGKTPINIQKDSAYTDAGATATDNIDGDITSKILTTNNVNINVLGTYYTYYNVTDSARNNAEQKSRRVNVMNL